jgi:preprotein translocase subunit SecE
MATDDEVEKKEAEDSSEEESEEEEASGDDGGEDASSEPAADDRAEDEDEDEEEEEGDDDEAEEPAPKKEAKAEKKPAKAEPKKEAKPAKVAKKKADEDEGTDEEAAPKAKDEGEGERAAIPTQLGHRRFVYAAYLAGTTAAAFVFTKALDYGWFKLSSWKPEWFMSIGVEPRDEIIVPVAVLIAIVLGVRYWQNLKVRTMAEEVAEELTKVTWPTRDEVTNSTTVVIITTIFATIFFALMDQFWLWVTKHVYGS